MPEKKKSIKFPPGASKDLKAAEKETKNKWAEGTEQVVSALAQSEWHSYQSRPKVEGPGYLLVMHWYAKEQTWVPIFLQHAPQVGAQLTRLFTNREKEATPIGKYLSSFPRSQRKNLWLKWFMDSWSTDGKISAPFRDVLEMFSAKYNHGEILAFNTVDGQSEVPENFSLLDY